MKLSVFSFKDNGLGCFTQPFYDDRPVENIGISIGRSIITSDRRSSYKHKVLYKIAEFDDATGVITACENELVLDCDELLASLPEVKANGSQEKN